MLTDMPGRPVFPQQDLADRVRQALEESRISQAELARACGVTDQAVHAWVTNGRIGKQHLVTICHLTKKPLEFFLVGLKTWRRAAAIALLLAIPPAVVALNFLSCHGCVLCQIACKLIESLLGVRFLTSFCPIQYSTYGP